MRVIGWETRSRNEGDDGWCEGGAVRPGPQHRAAEILVRPGAYL